MLTIDSGFIGDFKLGDNICYNLKILKSLYSNGADDQETQQVNNKLIILIIASIIEALLYDFHRKAKWNTREGIGNISEKILRYIRGKKIDEFAKYIASAKKHDIFCLQGEDKFYDDLHELRKLRNRIHIQNTQNVFEKDDEDAFSNERKKSAEKALTFIMQYMSENHNRGFNSVDSFILPWG